MARKSVAKGTLNSALSLPVSSYTWAALNALEPAPWSDGDMLMAAPSVPPAHPVTGDSKGACKMHVGSGCQAQGRLRAQPGRRPAGGRDGTLAPSLLWAQGLPHFLP